jgi:hypothetical protein
MFEEKSNEVSSPVLNNTQSRLSSGPTPLSASNKLNTILLNRKSKSQLPNSFSTPKVVIAKEMELLNTLYSSGAFENTQKFVTNPAEGSPIIGSANVLKKTAPALFDNDCSFERTPMIDSTVSIIDHATPALDNLSRNLKFEDENVQIENEKRKSLSHKQLKNKPIVEEDEELLAHMSEIEAKNRSVLDISQKK